MNFTLRNQRLRRLAESVFMPHADATVQGFFHGASGIAGRR
ncbi:hypothetical protein HMPREF9080_02007 [Cardiobacterium valvarum F0432]|uniref:Uncharacterized protein n=1 Tax=Cardiobacterium valvarum F0432 TaxID=797473 RepID=G9ZGP3_9GAMM|nr:hypothetical protein HMPREF9080_02007 [Cardiobacterium valvarum F0432]